MPPFIIDLMMSSLVVSATKGLMLPVASKMRVPVRLMANSLSSRLLLNMVFFARTPHIRFLFLST